MPRQLLKRFLPKNSQIKQHRSLKMIGHLLHEPAIWHLNRHAVARSFFIGFFVAMAPLPGHMLIAAFLSLWFTANLPLSIILVWINNPFTLPIIFYWNYWVGSVLLGRDIQILDFQWSFHWLSQQIEQVLLPMVVGGLVNGLLLGLAGFFLSSAAWHSHVRYRWRKRQRR